MRKERTPNDVRRMIYITIALGVGLFVYSLIGLVVTLAGSATVALLLIYGISTGWFAGISVAAIAHGRSDLKLLKELEEE